MDQIICVAGPTASGKTKLAVQLAKALNGEVISCDSMQIYRHMDIGTAKPEPAEMEGVPHHMLSVADPQEAFSVGRYVETADPILQRILSQGKTAILAGGTGLYMDAIIKGNSFAPYPATGRRQALEAQVQKEGVLPLLRQLEEIDPDSAKRLHPSDEKRIIRALEVYLETGKTITQHNLETQTIPPKYTPVWLGLDFAERAALYRRIDLRVDSMMDAGLLSEVQAFLAMGVPETATSMQAIGYKELAAALHGQCTIEEAVSQIKQSSRRYAKRQLTWFRRNSAIQWLMRRDAEDFQSIFSRATANIPFFDT